MAANLMDLVVAVLDDNDAVVSHEREADDVLVVDMVGGGTFSITIEEE